jgi:hypothetical protein
MLDKEGIEHMIATYDPHRDFNEFVTRVDKISIFDFCEVLNRS